MTHSIRPGPKGVQVADVLAAHIGEYQNQYPLWPEHRKIVSDLLNCRTAYLGGHIERCDACDTVRITYHSCRNRHCPKCQHLPRERWLEKRRAEILPVNYFHVVFTVPHELNTIILNNKNVMLNILFKAASESLLTFNRNKLGAKPGFFAILHSWDQKLNAHFHQHCLIANGGVSKDGQRWVTGKNNYLFNQSALSIVFRGKFMHLMERACQNEGLKFAGHGFKTHRTGLFAKHWVVSVRDPVKKPEHVLEYLARYTHRTAIANSRIQSVKDGKVTFTAKNRRKKQTESVTLDAVEFIRRFLLHSMPKGFVRIRHYGFLANRNRKENLLAIRQLLSLPTQPDDAPVTLKEMMTALTGIDITTCPCCKQGKMQWFADIPKYCARPPSSLLATTNIY